MEIEFILTDDKGHRYQGTAKLAPAEASAKQSQNVIVAPAKRSAKTLPEQILSLRDEGYFCEPRTPADVHAKLKETYHCLLDRVQMALLRLQRKKELRKAVKTVGSETQSAYVW